MIHSPLKAKYARREAEALKTAKTEKEAEAARRAVVAEKAAALKKKLEQKRLEALAKAKAKLSKENETQHNASNSSALKTLIEPVAKRSKIDA